MSYRLCTEEYSEQSRYYDDRRIDQVAFQDIRVEDDLLRSHHPEYRT